MLRSVAFEMLASALLAPVRMTFYSRFVLLNLLGRAVSWRSDERENDETSWGEALRRHGLDTFVATGWALAVYALAPQYFWWLTPVAGALIVSIPLSVLASRVRLGDAARRAGLLLVPTEASPPGVVVDLARRLRSAGEPGGAGAGDAFAAAVVDPYWNALHCAMQRRPRSAASRRRPRVSAWVDRALAEGPAALDVAARRSLLRDPGLLSELHWAVWSLDAAAARRWGIGGALPQATRAA